jgi:hypothetical protein
MDSNTPKYHFAWFLCAIAFCWSGSIGAATIFNDTFTWVDQVSSGEVLITVDVLDNFSGDFSRYEWRYTVDNISYDPTPGLTTGFSGLHEVFALPGVPDIGNQHGPAGWVFNQDHEGLDMFLPAPAIPPIGIGWDTGNPLFPGIMPGSSGEFGFTTPDNVFIGFSGPGLTVAHSYNVTGEAVGYFSGIIAAPFVPVPPAVWLFGSGLLGLAGIARKKKV